MISTDLNLVVGELLQKLLFWQERAKALTPLKAQKRLLSGLRYILAYALAPSTPLQASIGLHSLATR